MNDRMIQKRRTLRSKMGGPMTRAFIAGIIMGTANLVPGVSAATMAFLLGIYARLMLALSNIFTGKIEKKDLLFVFFVALGVLLGIVSFARVISILLDLYPHATFGAFSGLIVGGIPRFICMLERGKKRTLFWLLLGFAVIMLLSIAEAGSSESTEFLLERSASKLAFDVLAGFLGAASLVLPGLSGALVLLILGVYERAITAITAFDVVILASLGTGILAGIVVMSLTMKRLLAKYKECTIAFLTGLMIGSVLFLVERSSAVENPLVFVTSAIVAASLSFVVLRSSQE